MRAGSSSSGQSWLLSPLGLKQLLTGPVFLVCFYREQEIADEAARLKAAQDIADGEYRKKKKDGTGMDFDDSEEEEAYRKGNSAQRKEYRRKRKLDKMDPMDRVGQSCVLTTTLFARFRI